MSIRTNIYRRKATPYTVQPSIYRTPYECVLIGVSGPQINIVSAGGFAIDCPRQSRVLPVHLNGNVNSRPTAHYVNDVRLFKDDICRDN